MKIIKDNLMEIILLIGIINISIGFFIYSTALGFIALGTLLIALVAFLLFKGGD